MFGWVRKVLFDRASAPDRADRAAILDAKEREVRDQTAQIRRIRREAQLAEVRFRRGVR